MLIEPAGRVGQVRGCVSHDEGHVMHTQGASIGRRCVAAYRMNHEQARVADLEADFLFSGKRITTGMPSTPE
jgi:hypothetical protein